MTGSYDAIRVIIPLTIRRRNGRPKILPPHNFESQQARSQDPHILKALGRAWAWRRKIDAGEVTTMGELAALEGLTDRFVSRNLRLAYLSPDVLQRLLITRQPTTLSWQNLVRSTSEAWARQGAAILE